ncbi:MAG: hypothetical protein NTW78_10800 [Campylobacterales bacterium]|nr:hypothetical protein [Campylobacterales bacterium]
MKKAILIQARLSSSRFPNKMLQEINGMTLAEFVYNRCKESKNSDDVIIITSKESSDDALYNMCINKNITVFRGELDDVLKRYIEASKYHNIDIVCRVCGDSPFVDIAAIDDMFYNFEYSNEIEYIATTNSLNGFMSEIFRLNLLERIYDENLSKEDKEHVTKYIRDNILDFQAKELNLFLKPLELEKYTLTVDYPDDIVLIKKIASSLNDFHFTSNDIINILKQMENNK